MEDATQYSRRRRWRLISGAVAVVVLAMVMGRTGMRGLGEESGTITGVTRVGERRTVRLDDGSRVELSVNSSLRYPAAFAPAARQVTLIGEGFFVVAKDSARPFVVTAGPAAVQTFGASFGVRAYPGQNAAQVVVESGEVRVRPTVAMAKGTAAVLAAGAIARVARDGAITQRDSVDPAGYLEWRQGRISLNNLPLRAALAELARWQNVDLRIGDSVVANRRVTATFASHQTLTEILDVMALQLGARYEHRGKTVTFWLER